MNKTTTMNIREQLVKEMRTREKEVIEICSTLIKIPTENPPSDTREIGQVIGEILERSGASISYYTKEEPILNVVARIKGNKPGKRLIFNGHLDTFPAGDLEDWTVDPFGAIQIDGKLYGRGSSDMKGGVASSIFAFLLMAAYKEYWNGEIVLVLVGDEESGSVKGTEYVLDTVPEATGDVMIKGDAGSPMVLRFGEKGPFWIELQAEGKAAHGAHMYKGENAIDKLNHAINEIKSRINNLPLDTPKHITETIQASSTVSERLSGKGETDALEHITINVGVMEGGNSINIVPRAASAKLDIRLPIGVSTAQVEQEIQEVISSTDGLSYKVLQRYEPNWTDVNHEIFPILKKVGKEVMNETPVVTMRIGASDARIYRERGIPSVNCGLTPYNMGAPDEYIDIEELKQVAKMHTLAAFDYLSE